MQFFFLLINNYLNLIKKKNKKNRIINSIKIKIYHIINQRNVGLYGAMESNSKIVILKLINKNITVINSQK